MTPRSPALEVLRRRHAQLIGMAETASDELVVTTHRAGLIEKAEMMRCLIRDVEFTQDLDELRTAAEQAANGEG